MFRSLSQDARDDDGNMANDENAPPSSLSLHHGGHPVETFGRRRTRAQAKVEIHARREQRKRTREAMEAMAQRPMKSHGNTPPRTPTRTGSKIKIGASFGENLTIEHTPPRAEAAVLKRRTAAVQRTPEKTLTVDEGQGGPRVSRVPARGIAQSGSSGGGMGGGGSSAPRKRQISFSPERSMHAINEEAERLKRQRNLKATEKLQQRLEGPMRTPEKPVLPPSLSRRSTPTTTKSPTLLSPKPRLEQQTKTTTTEPTQRTTSPVTASASPANEAAVAPSPTVEKQQQKQQLATVRSDTPDSVASNVSIATMELPSGGEEIEDCAPSRASSTNATGASCKKELDFTVVEGTVDVERKETDQLIKEQPPQQEDKSSQHEPQTEHEEPHNDDVEQSALSQASQEDVAAVAVAEPQHTIGFGSSESFTSTSTIEDVGLFNCEIDVEFTGGVYGEGTDGKVSAAMVRGQKVALKRAKPHEGFPEEEAKRRSAIELHYLRRVRHVPGFVQCLGLCDGIEHTCIALEVMDCKLSDYLRRYGQHVKTKSSSKRRCFTLSLDATKSMLKQICQPMSELHDTVNVAHGDLACRNILLRLPPKGYEQKWEPVVKLSDFGRIKTPSSEPPIFDEGFSFSKNCDIGAFAREILYRLLVGEIVPTNCTETRTIHKHLQDVVVQRIPDQAKEKLGPYYRLFMRCTGWGVRPSFREIVDHLDDLEYFETTENGYFPLKPSSMGTTPSASQDTTSFLSPLGDERARKPVPSSDSKNKYETPTTANPRGLPATAPANPTAPGSGVRMLPSKSFTDGPQTNTAKTVNWLKARSVHPGGNQAGQQLTKPLLRPANPAALATPTATTSQAANSTPNGRPSAMPKKTPPSAGASRRSLQIINQLQHRLQEMKKC